jgi:hypothetical protein
MTEQLNAPNIVLDLPLPSELEHPNARPHRGAKAAAIAKTRWTAKVVASQHRPKEPFVAAAYRLTFWLPRKRDYDGLGSWVKAQIDGLVDAGILANDNDFRPAGIIRYSGAKETGGKYGVRFEIWQEEKPDRKAIRQAAKKSRS